MTPPYGTRIHMRAYGGRIRRDTRARWAGRTYTRQEVISMAKKSGPAPAPAPAAKAGSKAKGTTKPKKKG